MEKMIKNQSCPGKLLNYVRVCDFLGKNYEFKVNNKQKNKTLIGGILSIMIFVIGALYFVGIFIKNTKSSDIIFAGSQSKANEGFRLNNNNTKLFFEITSYQTNQGLGFEENIKKFLNFELQLVNQTRSNFQIARNFTMLSTTKCQKDFIRQFNLDESIMGTQQRENLVCIDSPFEIFGDFYSSNFNYLSIKFFMCENSSNHNNTCENKEKIQDFIRNGINIDLFILDSRVKRELNLTHPADESAANIFWRLNLGNQNKEDIYLQPISFDYKKYTIFSYLEEIEGESDEIYNGIRVASRERRIETVNDNTLSTFYIRMNNNKEYYFVIKENIVAKLLFSLSQSVGIIIAIADICAFCYSCYNEHKLLEILINSIFYVNDEDSKEIQTQENWVHYSEEEKQISNMFNHYSDYPFWIYILYEIIFFFRKSLKFSCFYISRQVIQSKYIYGQMQKRNRIAHQMAKEKLITDLDLTSIIKKLYEIDCLKLLLFDEDQLLLFNSFSTPTLNINVTQIKNRRKEKQKVFRVSQEINTKNKYKRLSLSKFLSQKCILQLMFMYILATSDQKMKEFSDFFAAQYLEKNPKIIIESFYQIITNKNQNQMMNHFLLRFLKYNNLLFQLVNKGCKNTYKIEEINPDQQLNQSQSFENIHLESSNDQKLQKSIKGNEHNFADNGMEFLMNLNDQSIKQRINEKENLRIALNSNEISDISMNFQPNQQINDEYISHSIHQKIQPYHQFRIRHHFNSSPINKKQPLN